MPSAAISINTDRGRRDQRMKSLMSGISDIGDFRPRPNSLRSADKIAKCVTSLKPRFLRFSFFPQTLKTLTSTHFVSALLLKSIHFKILYWLVTLGWKIVLYYHSKTLTRLGPAVISRTTADNLCVVVGSDVLQSKFFKIMFSYFSFFSKWVLTILKRER